MNYGPEKLKPMSGFEGVLKDLLEKGVGAFLSPEKIPDVPSFLRFLAEEKGYLLHGSNNTEITELEPRQANCTSKEFGNRLGVYAISDPILPMFYAIKDTEKARNAGVTSHTAQSGKSTDEKGVVNYGFKISKPFIDANAWSGGAIYILDKKSFVQGTDDEGNLIDEWLSEDPVIPVGKVVVDPKDFPFLEEIKEL